VKDSPGFETVITFRNFLIIQVGIFSNCVISSFNIFEEQFALSGAGEMSVGDVISWAPGAAGKASLCNQSE
jgi:hypothetical protein